MQPTKTKGNGFKDCKSSSPKVAITSHVPRPLWLFSSEQTIRKSSLEKVFAKGVSFDRQLQAYADDSFVLGCCLCSRN